MDSKKNKFISHWVEASEDNAGSMENLFNAGEYVWALFVGHLAVEKLLKAIYAAGGETEIPRSHDLLKLAVKCGLSPTESQRETLAMITLFNIEARYNDFKREFRKKCTRDFAMEALEKIREIRRWLAEIAAKS
ncbi:MAG: HEPN domain-containing protein [Candidatus Wallbacteria bacterium]|nr:HEPN domain-containing protein [Candidatus Wallbacteria bacterium]